MITRPTPLFMIIWSFDSTTTTTMSTTTTNNNNNNDNITNNSRLHRSPPNCRPCPLYIAPIGALPPLETSSPTLRCKGMGAWHALLGEGEGGGSVPIVKQVPNTILQLRLVSKLRDIVPVYPAPSMFPTYHLLNRLYRCPLCSCPPLPSGGCSSRPPKRRAITGGCNWASPLPLLPSFRRAFGVFSTSWHAAHPTPSPSLRYFFACFHARKQTYRANWSLASPRRKHKPPTGPRTNDGPTWSNGGARSGTYLDMKGKRSKKDQEREKKRAKTSFERGQELVLKGAQMCFERHKKWNLVRFEDLERQDQSVLAATLVLSSLSLVQIPLLWPIRERAR